MDSDPTLDGTVTVPTVTPSQSQGDKPGSATVTISKEQFDALNAKVDLLARGAQSEKDRAVGRLEREYGKLREELKPILERAATLIGEGKTVDAAISQVQSEQDDIETRQAIREVASALRSGTLPAATPASAPAGADMTGILQKYKLDGNDSQVNAILTSKDSQTAKELALANLAFSRASVPQPGPATALPLAGGNNQSSAMSDDEAERLYKELGDLLPNPSLKGNPARIAFIEKKLKDAGRPL